MNAEKPWIEETRKVMTPIIEYGYSFTQSTIRRILLDESGLNQRFPQPRGQSIVDDVFEEARRMAEATGYILQANGRYGLMREGSGEIHSLIDLPENMDPHKLWDVKGRFSCAETHVHQQPDVLDYKIIADMLNGERVIEIGCGWCPLLDHILKFNIKSYRGAEPFNTLREAEEKIRSLKDQDVLDDESGIFREDGLTYLLDCKDNSSVILSFGVLTDIFHRDPLHMPRPSPNKKRENAISERYARELPKEMFRVVKPGKFVYVGYWYFEEEWDPKFTEAGFEKDQKLEGLFWKR